MDSYFKDFVNSEKDIRDFSYKKFMNELNIPSPKPSLSECRWVDLINIVTLIWQSIENLLKDNIADKEKRKKTNVILKQLYALYIIWFFEHISKNGKKENYELATKVDFSLIAVRDYASTKNDMELPDLSMVDLLYSYPHPYPAILIHFPNHHDALEILCEKIKKSFDIDYTIYNYGFGNLIKVFPFYERFFKKKNWSEVAEIIESNHGLFTKIHDNRDELLYRQLYEAQDFAYKSQKIGIESCFDYYEIYKKNFDLLSSFFKYTNEKDLFNSKKNLHVDTATFFQSAKIFSKNLENYLMSKKYVSDKINDKELFNYLFNPIRESYNYIMNLDS